MPHQFNPSKQNKTELTNDDLIQQIMQIELDPLKQTYNLKIKLEKMVEDSELKLKNIL